MRIRRRERAHPDHEMDAGYFKWTVASNVEKLPRDNTRWSHYASDFLRGSAGFFLSNALISGALYAVGLPWVFGVWIAAYLTTYPLFVRIRSIAEHASMEHGDDVRQHTRTTRAGWIARMTVAPLNVNYHQEHHPLASVPFFRLPAMHRLLREKGLVIDPPSHMDVLKLAAREPQGLGT